MSRKCPILALIATITILPGCISRTVVPVDSGIVITKIYVLDNKKVHMKGLIDELVSQIKKMGFQSEAYIGDRPADANHYLTYTANWSWALVTYLTYFRASLYEHGRVLGTVEYDTEKTRWMKFGKLGKAANKIKPLLLELLQNVDRGTNVSVISSEMSPRISTWNPCSIRPRVAATAVGGQTRLWSR